LVKDYTQIHRLLNLVQYFGALVSCHRESWRGGLGWKINE
jgi:hypothetical protein